MPPVSCAGDVQVFVLRSFTKPRRFSWAGPARRARDLGDRNQYAGKLIAPCPVTAIEMQWLCAVAVSVYMSLRPCR